MYDVGASAGTERPRTHTHAPECVVVRRLPGSPKPCHGGVRGITDGTQHVCNDPDAWSAFMGLRGRARASGSPAVEEGGRHLSTFVVCLTLFSETKRKYLLMPISFKHLLKLN